MDSPTAVAPASQPDRQAATVTPVVTGPVAVPQKARRVYRGTGVIWGFLAALVAAALLIILIAQNTAPVTVHFLWLAPEVSLVVLVLASVVLTVCLTAGIGMAWRHSRRQHLTQRDELRRIHETDNNA